MSENMAAAPVQAGVARVFDEAAGYYRQLRWEKNRLTRFEKYVTQRTLERGLGSDKVNSALELGCGPGTWTGVLAERADSVVAVDISNEMLRQARREMAQRPHVDFVQSDVVRFDAKGRKFDRVISVRVLEYVPEWRQVVEGLGTLLGPGGRAVIITKTPASVWRGTGRERWFGPRTFARRLTGRKLNTDFWQDYIPVRSMVEAFSVAGLKAVEVSPVIFGLPIYMRGTKQYPIVPPQAERPLLWATRKSWEWVNRGSQKRRVAFLPLSESYAVSGRFEG